MVAEHASCSRWDMPALVGQCGDVWRPTAKPTVLENWAAGWGSGYFSEGALDRKTPAAGISSSVSETRGNVNTKHKGGKAFLQVPWLGVTQSFTCWKQGPQWGLVVTWRNLPETEPQGSLGTSPLEGTLVVLEREGIW